MTLQKAVALRINNLMIERDMSAYALAKKVITGCGTIQHILNEDYKTIKFDTLIKIAEAFDMTIQEFLNDKLFDKDNLEIY